MGGATAQVAPADNTRSTHEELLAVVLNMCEVSQAATDYVGVSTNIPVVLFQLLVMPVYYDEGTTSSALNKCRPVPARGPGRVRTGCRALACADRGQRA